MRLSVAVLFALLAGCTTTRYSHRCANGEAVEITADGKLFSRELGSVDIRDGCGGATIAQSKTDAVQAFEAGVKAASSLIKGAIQP
jgi:hypothetical protein